MPYAQVNGIHIRYEMWGVGETALVMLHGLGSSADDWMLQLPAFGPYFRCVLVDLRGHGLSDKPAGRYSVPLFAADVSELLARLGLASAHLLGLSLGGLVAQQLAIAQPETVRSLTLINTFPSLWPPTRGMLHTGMRRADVLLRRPSMAETATRVAQQLFPRPDQATLRAQAEARIAANDPLAYRRSLTAALRFHPGSALDQVTCPALIIAGERDTVVPMAYKERLRKRLPQAEFVVVMNSGHASNVDQPEAVNQVVLAFLRGPAGTSGLSSQFSGANVPGTCEVPGT